MGPINKLLLIALGFLFSQNGFTQTIDSTHTVNKKRLRTVVLASGTAYGLTLVGLNELWYKDSEKEPFHFFNDNNEWKQVDKAGQFYSAFYISYGTSKALTWCGLHQQKSNLW
jgi:hypothetical protein